jgi:NAD(P)-dependent dehydrogenase (short-subunit alcohol dehydrogenase family)
VVTGGGRGIGAAVARSLAGAGAQVLVVARSTSETEQVAADIRRGGGRADAAVCDVAEESAVRQMGDEARTRMGGVDILVLSAGIAASAPFRAITTVDWDRMMNVNARSVFLGAREFVPDMVARGWGRVVAIASTAGLTGGKYIAHYAASKHAVVGLVRSLAMEIIGTGVTVNAVCPGYVDTPMTERTLANVAERTGLSRAEALEAVLATTGQDRLLSPEEVAAEVLRLCGEEARDVSGRAVVVGAGAVRA